MGNGHETEKAARTGVPDNYRLLLDSHSHMAQYADKDSVSCIVFNFGYLPGGSIATVPSVPTIRPFR